MAGAESPPNAGYCVPPGSPSINNSSLVGNAINPVTYEGVRVSALWDIIDDWNALLTQSYQNIDAQGVFYQMPKSSDGVPLPPQSVTLFNPSYNKDKFENTALTVNGTLGDLKRSMPAPIWCATSARCRTTPTIRAAYMRTTTSATVRSPRTAWPRPASRRAATWNETERNTHQSHELRLSTPDDWRLRGIVGAFWEELQIEDQLNWQYKTLPACTASLEFGCLTDIGPLPGSTVQTSATRNDNVSFFNDVQRGYRQTAFFTSLDFDLIPKVLTFTAGTRYYRFVNDREGRRGGQLRLLRGGARALLCVRNQYRCRGPAYDLHGVQEPRQCDLALPAGCARLLHLVAGISTGRFQPQQWLLCPERPGDPPILLPARLCLRQPHQ